MLWRSPSHRPLDLRIGLDPSVLVVDLFPGITESTLRHMFNTPGVKGVVLKTYGAGNAPTCDWFYKVMSEAVSRGIVILNITQCANGGVNSRYYAGDRLSRAGVISGHDMTCEAAVTKMMHLFGMELSPEEVSKYMGCALIGEVTV